MYFIQLKPEKVYVRILNTYKLKTHIVQVKEGGGGNLRDANTSCHRKAIALNHDFGTNRNFCVNCGQNALNFCESALEFPLNSFAPVSGFLIGLELA